MRAGSRNSNLPRVRPDRSGILRVPRLRVLLGLMLVLAFAVWIMPRRRDQAVPVTGTSNWTERGDLQRRQVVWQPAEELSSIMPSDQAEASVSMPRFSEGGTTLYFTVRSPDGDANIYRSRLNHGRWEPGEPVVSLNSSFDDLGAVTSADGRLLLLCSNRSGGAGGFDLYQSQWENGEWTTPVNLGASVNSALDEFDPAISPDGRSLYFASNRMPAASSDRGPATQIDQSVGTSWNGQAVTRDLYVSERDDAGAAWESVAPMDLINRGDSDEAAPFVSPNGAFLYFASDRATQAGTTRNFDLYRVPLAEGHQTHEPPGNSRSHAWKAETLGPGINTLADESAPSLSPEGFTLIFSAERDGLQRILLSRAEEVRLETVWDSSNLRLLISTLSAIWPKALAALLMLLATVGVFFFARGRLTNAATSGQFFAGSVIVHLLILFLLGMWHLPGVLEVIASKKFEAEASTQIFDDNQHQSHEDGRAAYEKLADLQSLENTPQPEVTRQATEAFSVPERTENPLPTIPMEVARRMPAERLMFVPPNREQPARPVAASAAMPGLAHPTPSVVQAAPELPAAAVQLPEPVDVPGENLIATQIDMPRIEQVTPPVEFNIQVPNAPRLRVRSTTDLTPPAVEIGTERQATTLPSNPLEMRVALAPPETETLRLAETVVQPSAPVEAVEKVTAEATVVVAVDRITATTPSPVPFATEGKKVRNRQPQVSVELRAPTSLVEKRPMVSEKVPTVPSREAAPSAASNPLVGGVPLNTEEVLVAAAEASDNDTADDSRQNDVKLTIERTEADGPMPLTAKDMSGPVTRTPQKIVVGTLSLERNNAPPVLNILASTLDRPQAKATAVSLAADSVGLRSMFTLRQGDTRRQYIELFGGTEETEKAVNRGLVWLTQHQNPDGSWSLNRFHENCNGKHAVCTGHGNEASNTAATGLALLPLLAAGHTHLDGEYAKHVAAGLQWLIDHQKPDGELLGPGDNQKMYSQGIAAIALCEAFGMTQDPQFREPAQLALQYIIAAQNKSTGGWRYTPGEAGDTSVVGWQMMALKSGEMGGLQAPGEVHEGIRRWLKSVEGNKPVGGRFGYVDANVTPTMTAEGLLCLQFLGTSRNDSAMRAGADYLLSHLPDIKQVHSSYYWYYGTQVMYHMQGTYWQEWNTAMRDMVVETQIKDGHMAGTWDPADTWEQRGGRVYATSMKLLLLEIYYRHLPLYEQLDD